MKTTEFKKLQKQWYDILKKEGFEDIETIEHMDRGFVPMNVCGTFEMRNIVYFQQCRDFLNSGAMKDPLDMFILDKHCEGVSNRNIVTLLESHGFKKMHPASIDRRLLKILEKAEIEPVEFNA